jgi:DNA mismatch repair protein MutL
MESPRPVALLPPEVSRRIAAGEVIERPASVVRELLDNSLDAAAGSIDVSWEGGGVELIRVHDDGRGMTAEDLELCWHPHATSKIRSIEDLDTSRTLGFRGEALASVAAVSDLEIRTYRSGDTTGTALRVRHAEAPETGPAPPVPGTIVEVRQLFANLPARRRFLSRAQAESQAIRNVVLDKALPFPSIRFSHSTGSGETRVLPVHSLIERVGAVFGSPVPVESLHHVSGSGEGFSLTVVAAEPAIVRRDRRLIRIFVNNRRVQEYALVQAVEYAYRDVQHGGLFPAAAVLVDIDPALVDFNIHPAKREVRLRTGSEIHHRLVEILRSFLRTWTVRAVTLGEELWPRTAAEARTDIPGTFGVSGGPGAPDSPRTGRAWTAGAARSNAATGENRGAGGRSLRRETPRTAAHFDHATRAIPGREELVHRGTLFGTFLVVERGDEAWIIDQHAAHERLLYDRFAAARTSQKLLIPDEFEVTENQDGMLRAHHHRYREIGIELERVAVRRWQLVAMPGEYRNNSEDMIETILELGGLHEELDRQFVAEMACKAALKAGDYLDGVTVLSLAERTLALEEPRCPHGRPLYIELTRERLERLIGRR